VNTRQEHISRKFYLCRLVRLEFASRRDSRLLKKKHVFLVAALIICSGQIMHAQLNPIYNGPATLGYPANPGGFQAYPSNIVPGGWGISTPIAPAPEVTPGITPTNELVPSTGKQNVIEEATHKLWHLILTVQFGVYYDSNIFITEEHPISDTVFEAAGGFTFELGDYRDKANNFLVLRYLATGYIYTDHSSLDGVNQDVVFNGQYRLGSRTTLQANLAFSYLDGPDRLAGTYTSRYLVDGLVRLLYDLSDKTQLHAEFEQISDIYPDQLNSFEYIGRFGIDYLITPKISLGGEGVIGYLDPQDGGQSVYGQARLRVSYRMTQKFAFLASAGWEIRDYTSLDYIKATPVFDIGFDWAPFVDTDITLTAFRRVFASPVQFGEDFTATGLQVGVSQRFFQRFTATVYAGYENDAYHRNQSHTFESGRTDDFVFLRPSISYDWGGWFRAVVYYQFDRNSSTIDGASFNDNRVGIQLIFAF
jgi:hypothetical protein